MCMHAVRICMLHSVSSALLQKYAIEGFHKNTNGLKHAWHAFY